MDRLEAMSVLLAVVEAGTNRLPGRERRPEKIRQGDESGTNDFHAVASSVFVLACHEDGLCRQQRPIHNYSGYLCWFGINKIMDLKRLRTFVAVAEHGTVSLAALRLHTAQPALSRQIIDLEKELGITLFDRVGRRLRLTEEGEQLLGNCRRLLGYVSSLTDQAQELRRGDRGTLKVTAGPQMIDNVFSTFLPRYAKHYPDVQVRLIEGIGDAVLAMVERGEAQLGTVVDEAVPVGNDHFGSRPLLPIAYSAAYHTAFELGRGHSIDIRSLAPQPLLLLAPNFVLRKTFDAACRLARFRPNIQFECSSPHTLLSLAEAGHGVAIVPSNVRLHRYALKTRWITHQRKPLHEPLSIFWDKRRSLPRYAQDFCELLAGFIREVIPTPPRLRTRKSRKHLE